MICYYITDFFSCIFPIIFPYNCKKATVCKFIIVLLTVDKCKSTPVIVRHVRN